MITLTIPEKTLTPVLCVKSLLVGILFVVVFRIQLFLRNIHVIFFFIYIYIYCTLKEDVIHINRSIHYEALKIQISWKIVSLTFTLIL